MAGGLNSNVDRLVNQNRGTKYRRRIPISPHSANGQNSTRQMQDWRGIEYLKQQDPVELLRKLDELRDQITRSCQIIGQPRERQRVNRRALSLLPDPLASGGVILDGSPQLSRNPSYHSQCSSRNGGGVPSPYEHLHAKNGVHGYRERYRRETSSRYARHVSMQRNNLVPEYSDGYCQQNACSCPDCQYHRMVPGEHIPMARYFGDGQYYPFDRCSSISSESYDQRSVASSLYSHKSMTQRRALHFSKRAEQVCRPARGAAPFVTCSSCYKLLQLPLELPNMGKRVSKLQCGSCFVIIGFRVGEEKCSSLVPTPSIPVSETIRNSNNKTRQGLLDWRVIDGDFDFSFPEECDSPRHNIDSADENSFSSTISHERTEKDSVPNTSNRWNVEAFTASPSRSEDMESPENVICQRDPDSHMEVSSFNQETAGSPVLEESPENVNCQRDPDSHMEVPSYNQETAGSPVLEEKLVEPISSEVKSDILEVDSVIKVHTENSEEDNNGKLQQLPVKDAQALVKTESSLNEFSNSTFSRDSSEVGLDEDQPVTGKSGDSFFGGILKRGFKDFSLFNQSMESNRPKVSINGHSISDRSLKKAEKKAGPVEPGNYWYDYHAGFWGIMGHECVGIIPSFIKEFNYPMARDCAGGNTGVLVNGRELHQKDLDVLVKRGLPRTSGKSYAIEISGKVIDEASGKKLKSLGKLAPTVEKLKRGFGMHVPDDINSPAV